MCIYQVMDVLTKFGEHRKSRVPLSWPQATHMLLLYYPNILHASITIFICIQSNFFLFTMNKKSLHSVLYKDDSRNKCIRHFFFLLFNRYEKKRMPNHM